MADDHSSADFEPPHPNGSVHQSGISRARPARRRLFLIGGLALVAVWIFAIVWSVTVTSHSPERLDVASAQRVASQCATAQQQLQRLPNPSPI